MGTDQEARRQLLYSLLGDLPDRSRPITARKVAEEDHEPSCSKSWSSI